MLASTTRSRSNPSFDVSSRLRTARIKEAERLGLRYTSGRTEATMPVRQIANTRFIASSFLGERA